MRQVNVLSTATCDYILSCSFFVHRGLNLSFACGSDWKWSRNGTPSSTYLNVCSSCTDSCSSSQASTAHDNVPR